MSTPEPDQEHEGLDERIDQLHQKAGGYLETCQFQSAYRIYGELRRLGKNEQRAIPYINAVFHQMDLAQSLLEPSVTRENAVELIALLEDEERARQLQPDFPAEEYEAEAAWMTACAYENLAEATGMLEGYNSEGMHQCITDGIQVCRRTGKLACVGCFREYASQVYTAADDLDMALHHSRTIAANTGPYPDRGDRRHLGARNEGWLLLLQGQLDAAEVCMRRSLALCDGERVSIPLSGRLQALADLEAVLLLSGKQDPTSPSPLPLSPSEGERGRGEGAVADTAGLNLSRPAAGERPDLELRWAYCDALRACCRGDYAEAVNLLSSWDRRLTAQHCLHDWFETRLRLIATTRLAGQTDRAQALARPLEEKARQAHDWLTVRRLTRLLDPSQPATPLALLAPLTAGPFGSAPAAAEMAGPPPTTERPGEPAAKAEQAEAVQTQPQQDEAPVETTPLEDFFNHLVERHEAAPDDEREQEELLKDILGLPPAQVTHPLDAMRLLNFLRLVLGDGSRGQEVWRWAEAVASSFVPSATVLSLLAVVGDLLRDCPEAEMEDEIPAERIEQLFRQSLDLDPEDPGNHARAGTFFLHQDNLGEAERCLARGFRLQRSNSFLALRLAEVYNQTERPRDALAVLDLNLREGGDDPQVAWEAALAAFNLNQYDVQLTYLDRFEAMTDADAWASYYRATALLELGRPEEALAALDEAERREPSRLFPIEILRACAASALGRPDDFREHLEWALAVRWAKVDYLTITGLANLSSRLWKAASCLPADDPLRQALHDRLLQTGMAPDELFEAVREGGEEVAGINYYRCEVLQPLDERWADWPGCLAGQQAWSAYRMVWGVLADDEDEAAECVLAWQARCYPLPASVEEIDLEADGFTDKPGVVWQGYRSGEAEEEEEAEADE